MLTPRLGRAVARALLPTALLTATIVAGAATAPTRPTMAEAAVVAPALVVPAAVPLAIVPSTSAAIVAARRAAAARALAAHRARALAAHRALVLRRTNAVVAWALRHVGANYAAGSTGPRAFDCSGLTLAAWRTQGVGLPHYSAAQYRRVRHVPLSQLRPGDLLFYLRNGAHHVAIYVGHGRMVSADYYGTGVRLEPFLFSWFGQHFTGVGRVLS